MNTLFSTSTMPRFTTSSTTYGAFYARPQAPSAGVKKHTASIDNPYTNSLIGMGVFPKFVK